MKQLIKLVEVKSLKRYPYNGKYHFNVSLIDMKLYKVEHVRRDGRLAQWQPKEFHGHFKTEDDADNSIIRWAKKPIRSYRSRV